MKDVFKSNFDAILHALAALFACAILVWATTPWGFMALANGLFWLGREQAQAGKRWPSKWSLHKHIEWLAPAIVGIISSYVSYLYF